mmetsp:Transcript_5697/g.7284  ORF Transcript_5697/g.7284 Transcript_5697/m.7284 type:complete len:223 (+) Transcript_5697:17-685(+)
MAQNAPAVESTGGHSKAIYFKTALCKFHLRHACSKGAACQFAHSSDELRPCPDLRRTKMCPKLMRKGSCGDYSCTFAHRQEQVRRIVSHAPPGPVPPWDQRRAGGHQQAYQHSQFGAEMVPAAASLGEQVPDRVLGVPMAEPPWDAPVGCVDPANESAVDLGTSQLSAYLPQWLLPEIQDSWSGQWPMYAGNSAEELISSHSNAIKDVRTLGFPMRAPVTDF